MPLRVHKRRFTQGQAPAPILGGYGTGPYGWTYTPEEQEP